MKARKPALKSAPASSSSDRVAHVLRKLDRGRTISQGDRDLIRAFAQNDEAAKTTGRAKNLTELAQAVGVTRQTIHKYQRRSGAPRPASNGTHDVVAWRIYLAKQGAIDDPAVMPDKTVLDAQILHLRAALLSMDLAEREREVIKRSDHLAKLQLLAETFTHALLSMPDRVASFTRDAKAVEAVRSLCAAASQSVQSQLRLAQPEKK